MKNNTYEKGIGLVAILVIVAVVAVGGFATYKVAQNTQVDVDTTEQEEEAQETVAEIRSDVVSTLGQIKASVVLSAQASVDAAVKSLNDLSARVDQAALTVEGEARAELVALKSEVESLRAKLEAKSSSVMADIDTVVDGIQADINADAGVEADSHMDDGSMEDDDSVIEGEGTMEGDASVDDEGTSIDIEADASAEASY